MVQKVWTPSDERRKFREDRCSIVLKGENLCLIIPKVFIGQHYCNASGFSGVQNGDACCRNCIMNPKGMTYSLIDTLLFIFEVLCKIYLK